MNQEVILPAQCRTARALINWSQEQLAQEAGVGLSTVRDFESEKRAAVTEAVGNLSRALRNGGVVFTPGSTDEGPGVRLVAGRPNIIRRPTTVQKYEGIPFGIEWQGKTYTIFVAYSVIEDLGRFSGKISDEDAIKTFDKHRGLILDAITVAIEDPENFDPQNRLYIRQKDLDAAQSGQWHMVATASGADVADIEARELIHKFAKVFFERGIPPNVEVYRHGKKDGSHVFYFSPMASKIGASVLKVFKATACAKMPNLDSANRIKF